VQQERTPVVGHHEGVPEPLHGDHGLRKSIVDVAAPGYHRLPGEHAREEDARLPTFLAYERDGDDKLPKRDTRRESTRSEKHGRLVMLAEHEQHRVILVSRSAPGNEPNATGQDALDGLA